jgi:hypothetical protein
LRRGMAEAPVHRPEVVRISASFDVDVSPCACKDWGRWDRCAAAVRGDIPAEGDFGGVINMPMVVAESARWCRALEPAFGARAAIAPLTDGLDCAPPTPAERNEHGVTKRRADAR